MDRNPKPSAGRFLALGDSYTIGEGVRESERWPMQLSARLRGEGIPIADPQIIARTGWTTDELSAAMDVAQFEPLYALVSLSIGVNNQYRGRSIDEYHAQFRGLLERAIVLAGNEPQHVVVISIPDWGVTSFARSRDPQIVAGQIDSFNAAAREQTIAAGAHWVDVTGISRDPDYRALLVADGLHPAGAQYTRWAEGIAVVAAEILRR